MSRSAQTKMVGSREPVDPNKRHIIEIADWAVKEYNKEHGTTLKFARALKAEQEVVAGGTMYYIDLEASNVWPLQKKKYFAKVSDQPKTNTRKLLEFKPQVQENERTAVAN